MPMIAIPLPEDAALPSSRVACPMIATDAITTSGRACDFSDDGRLVRAVAADRSAWQCPLFYLAVPASALLFGMVVVVRFSHTAAGAVGRILS